MLDGLLYDAGGTRAGTDRPRQLFSRWYGFALTFPKPEIFGVADAAESGPLERPSFAA